MATEAVVVAHYHPNGRLAGDLLELVREFVRQDRQVIFVSTRLGEEGAARVAPYATVIRRENFGYDFWSYRVGLDALGNLAEYSRLLMCNSSFVTLDAAQLCSAYFEPVTAPALRGLTASHDGRFHLQSYWISFENASLIGSAAFRDWWAGMTPISDRQQVIDRYERGLTDWFMKAGFATRAAYVPSPEDQLVAICRAIEARLPRLAPGSVREQVRIELSAANGLNPTHFLWDVLFERFGVIKLDLLMHNRERLNLHAHLLRMQNDHAYRSRILDATAS
jgi:rhamnosyltransferase